MRGRMCTYIIKHNCRHRVQLGHEVSGLVAELCKVHTAIGTLGTVFDLLSGQLRGVALETHRVKVNMQAYIHYCVPPFSHCTCLELLSYRLETIKTTESKYS